MPLLQKGYLGSTPLFRTAPWFDGDDFTLLTSSAATTLTASATSNTKGSYSQVIASTSGQTTFVVVIATAVGASTINTGCLVDIATGASGSETVVLSNLAFGGASASIGGLICAIPLRINSGTRISARMQSATASRTGAVRIFLYDFGDATSVPTSADTIGSDTAASSGTRIAANNAWTQITSSTSKQYIGFVLIPSVANANIAGTNSHIYELGVGASGSEVVIGSVECRIQSDETCGQNVWQPIFFPNTVASGSRIAVRQNINVNTVDAMVVAIAKP